jgi:RNA polymerase sigma factor (sigma-70 family)
MVVPFLFVDSTGAVKCGCVGAPILSGKREPARLAWWDFSTGFFRRFLVTTADIRYDRATPFLFPGGAMEEREVLDLLAAIRAGNEARNRLLHLVRVHLHSLATHHAPAGPEEEPSDLVQESAVVVLKQLGSFRGKSLGEFLVWLQMILDSRITNKHRDATRQRRDYRRNVPLETAPPVPVKEDAPPALAEQAEQAECLQRELARLPREQQLIFLLRTSAGRSVREIATLLDQSESHVQSLYALARDHLKHCLGNTP